MLSIFRKNKNRMFSRLKNIIFTSVLISLTNIVYASPNLDGFSVIREFNGADVAALFGILPSSGKLQISHVHGPSFLGSYRIGELNESTVDRIFQTSSRPMNQDERASLLSKYKGASIMYFEGYQGNLCTNNEMEYQITVDGTLDNSKFELAYQLIALPNSSGDCTYHKIIIYSNVDPLLTELHQITA